MGNVIGSNVFDMLMPPGTAALIASITVTSRRLLFVDLPVLLLLSLLALLFFARKRGLQKREALALLCAYSIYATLRVLWA